MSPADDALVAAIRRARVRNGLTQVELAERLGVSRALVAAWEAGRSEPNPADLAEMKRVLGRIRREHGREPDAHRSGDRLSGRGETRATSALRREDRTVDASPRRALTRGADGPTTVRRDAGSTDAAVEPRNHRSGNDSRSDADQVDIYDVAAHLWETADELRANSHLKAGEYSIPVLGLIFLKFADNRFTEAEAVLAPLATERNPLTKEKYQSRGVLYLPEVARFDRLLHLPGGKTGGRPSVTPWRRSSRRIHS